MFIGIVPDEISSFLYFFIVLLMEFLFRFTGDNGRVWEKAKLDVI
jgi:hypothetical protein